VADSTLSFRRQLSNAREAAIVCRNGLAPGFHFVISFHIAAAARRDRLSGADQVWGGRPEQLAG
jgi:hypothetical protein